MPPSTVRRSVRQSRINRRLSAAVKGGKVLTLAAARKMVAAAEAEAKRQHLAEDGGWPILIERMDHAAYVASVELAPGKAS